MKKFLKAICLLLCMISAMALFAACTKPDDESQGSTNDGGGQVKLSDYFEEEVYDGNKFQSTTLTKLTDNISWNSDITNSNVVFTVKKSFKLLGVSFDIKSNKDDNGFYYSFRYNGSGETIFKALNADLKQDTTLNLQKDVAKTISCDMKKYMSKGYSIEKGSTFEIGHSHFTIIDSLKFTINAA